VLNNSGLLLSSFGCDNEDVKSLHQPRGVCVSGQYAYVSNWRSHSVFVFTTAGKYITSFGRCGSDEGHFPYPHGLCVDNYVWIADVEMIEFSHFES